LNYYKLHNQIIARALARKKPDCYCEIHHIKPKSMGGSDHKSNLVFLTAREHFIIHWLLAKIYGGKMWSALFFMCGKSNSAKGIIACKRLYEIAKSNLSEHRKKQYKGSGAPNYGKKFSQETKDKMSCNRPRFFGSRNHQHDSRIFNFENIDTGLIYRGTKSDFCREFNLNMKIMAGLCTAKRKSYKRWFCSDSISIDRVIKNKNFGDTHPKFKKQIYVFLSPYGEKVTSNCYDLYKSFNLHKDGVYDIVIGRRKTHKGWAFLGESQCTTI
jgi:hypothetical protein